MPQGRMSVFIYSFFLKNTDSPNKGAEQIPDKL
jgi:hypothetical protein